MKIAIIGSGISGLTAAHVLHRQHHISIFEANDYAGGHTNTIEVNESGTNIPIDTGFIVFNEQNYPRLCALFSELGVASRGSDMSFSVHCERSGLEYNGTNFDKLFSQRRNLFKPQFWAMLKDIHRFHRDGPAALTAQLSDGISVAEFAAARGYSRQFIDHYLIPLGASLWSCPAERFAAFSMRFVLEFLRNHGMLQVDKRPQWRTVVGGSAAYVQALIRPFKRHLYLNTAVKKVQRRADGVRLIFADGAEQFFDQVIIATHAPQALRMVADMDEEERAILAQFPYQDNEAVLHTDISLLPRCKNAWASWNYRIPAAAASHVAVTYNMNILQGLATAKTYCVSLNQAEKIKPEHIIRRIFYQHPVFYPGRDQAQSRHYKLIQRRGISYCGAYWGYGFHEDGVRSALAVTASFALELAA